MDKHYLFIGVGQEDPSKYVVFIRGGGLATSVEGQSSPSIYGAFIWIHNTMGAIFSRQQGSFNLQNIPEGLTKIRFCRIEI